MSWRTDKALRAQMDASHVPALDIIEAELKKEQERRKFGRVFRSTVYTLVVVAAIAVLIFVLLLPVLQISGTSMSDTLNDEDIVVAFNGSSYKTGDIVAFYFNNQVLVKRVIASAGQMVDIDEEGNVFVDGEPLYEPYLKEKVLGECDITLPYLVPDKRIFVMGDHRLTSVDSRNEGLGCIDVAQVLGRVIFRVWPFSGFGLVH